MAIAPGVDGSVLAGELTPKPIDEDAVDQHEEDLVTLAERLSSYASGIRRVDPDDPDLLHTVESLRGLLEMIYQQHITFRGEQRSRTGSSVDVALTAQQVDGWLSLARIGTIRGGAQVRVQGELGTIGPGGHAFGIEAETIGD
ncbi:hypothetical protein [Streptomyces sp. NPDC056468]|uniref:hypothetical protein n=1 Tax=Streptomyces sp. NPDC056468 TaxID=3345830 RepID=UPI0036801954